MVGQIIDATVDEEIVAPDALENNASLKNNASIHKKFPSSYNIKKPLFQNPIKKPLFQNPSYAHHMRINPCSICSRLLMSDKSVGWPGTTMDATEMASMASGSGCR